MKWSSQSRPMTDSVASQGAERPPPHDLRGSWPYRRYLMGLWHVWLPPGAVGARRFGALWRPVATCGALWQPVAPCGDRLDAPILRVWSHRCLMPGGLRLRCPDATLAGLAGWLAWLAGLAGWLMGGSLTRSTLWGGRRTFLT